MIKALSSLQDLRRRMYHKAKSEKTHRFWGLFVHVAKLDTLTEAYQQAKRNGGAPGLDGHTFADIEAGRAGAIPGGHTGRAVSRNLSTATQSGGRDTEGEGQSPHAPDSLDVIGNNL